VCNVQEVNNTTKLMIICVKEEEKKKCTKKFRENFLFSGIDSYKNTTKPTNNNKPPNSMFFDICDLTMKNESPKKNLIN
jgi:hypothetical protein